MRIKKGLSYFILLLPVPLAALGAMIWSGGRYTLLSVLIAALCVAAAFLSFEKRRPDAREIALLAVMVALCTAGRLAFAFVPGFKPVTALTVLAGIYLGGQSGFMVGALSALLSNLYFGQGPWTPVQMCVWGLIGLLAGALARPLKACVPLMCVYGVFAGAAFSLAMDVFTVMSASAVFTWGAYIAAVSASLPFMAMYAVSNVIFLSLLTRPFGKKIERIQTKYGLFGA